MLFGLPNPHVLGHPDPLDISPSQAGALTSLTENKGISRVEIMERRSQFLKKTKLRFGLIRYPITL
jgi:hypothetical protein